MNDRGSFDFVVVGGGPAGIMAALTAAKQGKKVALLEKSKLGGACVWNGCIPSKALLKSAKLVRELGRLKRHAIDVDVHGIDTQHVMKHIREVMDESYDTYAAPLLQHLNITVISGDFAFDSPHQLSSSSDSLRGDKILIAVGAQTAVPPIPGLESIPYLTNDRIFALPSLPRSLIVIGAGAIGIELASALARLGTEVSVILREDRILRNDDPDLSALLQTKLEEEGIRFYRHSQPERFLQDDQGVILEYRHNDALHTLNAENVLIATGRKPDTDSLRLENAGVELDRRQIRTDPQLRTDAAHIYAAGDCVGPFGFTHAAEYQAYIATCNALEISSPQSVDYAHFGWCTFTDPEVAGMGLGEAQARERFGDGIQLYRQEYKHIHRGLSDDKMRGLAKIICDSQGKILGATIIGERAAELVNELIVAAKANLPLQNLADTVHIYPSFSDVIVKAARQCRDAHLCPS